MKSICVFAGSAKGVRESYSKSAKDLGLEIANREFSMVYGGGSKGLMGIVADAALEGGATVTGVITERLHDVEVGHNNLTSLEIVPSMHDRKARMAELSDAIISLPGGVGTWEEFFEALAWNQLGIYSKPIILFDRINHKIHPFHRSPLPKHESYSYLPVRQKIKYIHNHFE